MTILDHFPYPSFRPYQEEILKLISDYYESYDTFMIEAPTGFGKSGVADTIADWIRAEYDGLTHVCAADKYLQEQYLKSFPQMAMVKGRNNFTCSMSGDMLVDFFSDESVPPTVIPCNEAPCTFIKGFPCLFKPRAMGKDEHGIMYDWSETTPPLCPYYVQKDKAIRADIALHNYHYFLYENMYAHSFTKRQFGIFDEAHQIESILMGFVEEKFTEWALRRINQSVDLSVRTTIPRHETISEWSAWLYKIHQSLMEIIELYGTSKDLVEEGITEKEELSVRLLVENTMERIGKILSDITRYPDNWVWIVGDGDVTFKPVRIGDYSGYLFNHVEKKLLMSATILDKDKMKNYLGIYDDVKFLRVDKSTFPVQNRPFYQAFIGKATRKTMATYLPKLIRTLDTVYIPQNLEHKGVIHTHTHKIARHITENSKYKEHMMTNTGSDKKREDVFQGFFDAEAPKIMVSPSINMGVDLKDDLCRWQIICKVPYPNLGDPQIRKRVDVDKGWYDWITAMNIIQTYGRGCRSEEDWCHTYVLDGKFGDLYAHNYSMFPRWFKDATRVFSGR